VLVIGFGPGTGPPYEDLSEISGTELMGPESKRG